MRVVEKPGKVIRIRIDEMVNGQNVKGCQTIHLTDTTVRDVYNKLASALGVAPLPDMQEEKGGTENAQRHTSNKETL
jgi:hypothetical protein